MILNEICESHHNFLDEYYDVNNHFSKIDQCHNEMNNLNFADLALEKYIPNFESTDIIEFRNLCHEYMPFNMQAEGLSTKPTKFITERN